MEELGLTNDQLDAFKTAAIEAWSAGTNAEVTNLISINEAALLAMEKEKLPTPPRVRLQELIGLAIRLRVAS